MSIILSFLTLGIIRLGSLPQFADTYYHLLTAWGFLEAGGYSGWDFWQYAPLGRVHIYPPLLHIVMASFMKLGLLPAVTGKIFEFILPPLLLFSLWYFLKRAFNERIAFFSLALSASSFGFYVNLAAHPASTLAAVFGLLATDNLLRGRKVEAALLLTLCFYTHIAVPWFFAIVFLSCFWFRRQDCKGAILVLAAALLFSCPQLVKQFFSATGALSVGMRLQEKYLSCFKPLEYLFAAAGIWAALRDKKGYLALSFMLGSLVFIFYPYRFFVAEGYLAVVLLAALGFDYLYCRFTRRSLRMVLSLALFFIFLGSPSVAIRRSADTGNLRFGLLGMDSAFTRLALAEEYSGEAGLRFPDDFSFAAAFIRRNSGERDIVYSNLDVAGVALAALSGRATSNALLPEIKPSGGFDPFRSSAVIALTRDEKEAVLAESAKRYGLEKIREERLFYFYHNPSAASLMHPKLATVPWPAIGIIAALAAAVLLKKYLT